MEPRVNRLIIVLADISGYTELMRVNQTAAVHGQMIVTQLIESIIKEVEIPLHLQEIEGDAVFLYAPHPESESGWREVCSQVGRKLTRFFESFAAAAIEAKESTLCRCAVCSADDLRLKLVVHSGEAVFHSIDRFDQVSGLDVIKAHRLLKNSVPSNEYILLTDSAFDDLGSGLDLDFQEGLERYEGLGSIKTHVHFMGEEADRSRRKFYSMSSPQVAWRGVQYAAWVVGAHFPAFLEQVRNPVAEVDRFRRISFGVLMTLAAPFVFVVLAAVTPVRLLLRRTKWA
jgi:hypothetical protein